MERKYNGMLDFWKFVFCFVILIFHIGNKYGEGNVLFKYGQCAVEFFFIASGYLMCLSAERAERNQPDISLGRETIGMIGRKLKGLMPAYIFCYILGLFGWFLKKGLNILQTKGRLQFILNCIRMTPNFLLLHGSGAAADGAKIIGLSWYISVMLMVMLFTYPLLRKFKETYAFVVAPLLALLLSGILVQNDMYFSMSGAAFYVLSNRFTRGIIGINLGICVYMISGWLGAQDLTKFKRIVLSLAEPCFYLVAMFLMNKGSLDDIVCINICYLFGMSITVSGTSVVTKHTNNGFFKLLGRLSMWIYLCQSPMRRLVLYYFPDLSYKWGLVYVTLGTLVAVAMGLVITNALAKINSSRKAKLS